MYKAYLKSFLLTCLLSFSFAAVHDWDCDGDGVLGNYNDYQNNGSVTAAVFVVGANLVSDGDLFEVFVDGEQRGAFALTEVPFEIFWHSPHRNNALGFVNTSDFNLM